MSAAPLKLGELVLWNFTRDDYAIGMISAYRQYGIFNDNYTYDIVWIYHSSNADNVIMSPGENELPHETLVLLRDNYIRWRKNL